MKRTLLTCSLLLLGTATPCTLHGQATTAGLIIETIDKFSAPAQAGLRSGDVLLSWQRTTDSGSTTGEFKTPFDGRLFELEELPRGNTRILFLRDGTQLSATLTAGFFGVNLRPVFSQSDLAVYLAGLSFEEKDPEAALTAWRPLIDRLAEGGSDSTAAWLLSRVGSAFVRARQISRSRETFHEAILLARRRDDVRLEALIWEAQGLALNPDSPRFSSSMDLQFVRENADAAVEAQQEAWRLRQKISPNGLAASESLLDLGWAESNKSFAILGLPTEGEMLFRQGGARIQESQGTFAALAPGSFARARAMFFLARFVANDFDQLSRYTKAQADAAYEPLAREAWQLFERNQVVHPLFLDVLNLLENHLLVQPQRSVERETVLRKLLSIARQLQDRRYIALAAGNLSVVLAGRGAIDESIDLLRTTLQDLPDDTFLRNNLAVFLLTRGDLGASEDLFFTNLDRAKSSAELIHSLEAIAHNDLRRGDLTSAEALLNRVLELREQDAHDAYAKRAAYWADQPADLPPDRAVVKARETNPQWHRRSESTDFELLAEIAIAEGNTTRAREALKEAVALDAFNPLMPLNNIGQPRRSGYLARLEGDFRSSEASLSQVLQSVQKTAAGSNEEANALEDVGVLQYLQHHLDSARRTLESASAIRERIQPGSQAFATTLHWRGLVERDDAHLDQAEQYFLRALDVLDDQRTRLGVPSFSLSGFSGSVAAYYADAAAALIAEGRPAEAFHVLERSRARTMLEMVSQRSLAIDSEPAELAAQRRQLEAEYDALQTFIERTSPAKQSSELTDALARLREIRLKLDYVSAEIAKASPRLAGLRSPTPFTLQRARASLETGTVLLSYLVGQDRTYLFIVTAGAGSNPDASVSVAEIKAGEKQLRENVEAFRNLIDWQADPKTANRGALQNRAQQLYDLLIKPAETQIAAADRILLSLDGPLHVLPFAALARTKASGVEFLAEWKPLHTTLSMTVYAEMRSTASAGSNSQQIVAFGDPSYGASAVPADPEVAFFTRRGAQLTSLPASRREVTDIQKLFGSNVTAYLGAEATEENAKAISSSAKYVHFAVHGVVNQTLPLNSALVLAQPTQSGAGIDNGLLQAWEIVAHMHLAADLVTLSACDSGLGKEIAGEGLLGLTSAFLYAGARSVVASLWKVADGPTEVFMKHFYANLRDGQSKDQALRNAQVALIRMGKPTGSPIDYSDPVYWAAFQLTGDWK